jgi:hypothetical protein
MSYLPKKANRHYIKPLWKMKKDGTKGDLVCHSCVRCKRQVDGKAKGTWFEHAEDAGLWCFVCSACY